MNTFIIIAMGFALFSVVAVLGLGLFSMTKGGEFNKKYGNKLMQARIALQAVAVGLVFLALLASHK